MALAGLALERARLDKLQETFTRVLWRSVYNAAPDSWV